MAYKQSPLTMIRGTAGHKSALKAKISGGYSYPSSSQFGPYGPKGTLDQVKSIVSSGTEGGLSGTAYEKSKVASKTSKLQKFLKPAKEVIKKVIPSGVRTGLSTAGKFASKAFLPLAIAETMYSFGKTSVERKKAGQSGFNISKSKTNKGFNFNK